jgi:16S rRNA (guanine(527)-N(7))-methyltransferase RsmG
MKEKNSISPRALQAWAALAHDYSLTQETLTQLKEYGAQLLAWNKKSNLTRITDDYEVVEYHIRDSLVFGKMVDCTHDLLLCDVGTGGGLPGIPLKIVYPHIKIILLEVVDKKVAFLNHVIAHFGFNDIDVCTLDWRTFIRTTDAPIDYFVARASLRPDELLRIYRPGCTYRNARVVYWAADSWKPENDGQAVMINNVYSYNVGVKNRRLIVFAVEH